MTDRARLVSTSKRAALAKRAGPIKRVHVDQAVIKRNRKSGRNEPAITVQTSAGPLKVREVAFLGNAKLVQRKKPLACGARVFIETTGSLRMR